MLRPYQQAAIKVAVDRYQRELNREHGMGVPVPNVRLKCA